MRWSDQDSLFDLPTEDLGYLQLVRPIVRTADGYRGKDQTGGIDGLVEGRNRPGAGAGGARHQQPARNQQHESCEDNPEPMTHCSSPAGAMTTMTDSLVAL